MSDLFNREVTRNYYQEALIGRKGPQLCTECYKRGRFARNMTEILRRIPSLQRLVIIECSACKGDAMRHEDASLQRFPWYCENCRIVLCTRCQK